MKRFFYIFLAIVLLAVVAYLVYQWQVGRSQAELEGLQIVTASRGNLTATIGATGLVRSNQTAILVWQTSGSVEKIDIQTGSQVNAGQVLAELAQSSLAPNVILAQVDLNNAQKALEDLKNSQLAQTQASQALNEARRAVIEAEQVLAVFDQEYYKDRLKWAEDKVVDTKEKLDAAIKDFEPYKDRDPDNSTRKSYQERIDKAQERYDEAVRERDLLILDREKAVAALEIAKARLADSQREVDRLKDGPTAQDIANLEARIAAAQATLDTVQIAAPFGGTITDIMSKSGDQVGPGSLAFQIDDLSMLLVDVKVSEVDINRVKVGQDAILSFDAILGKEYHGSVIEVGRVGNITQGVVEFKVTIALTDDDEDVKPGMTAAVNIVVNQLENVLLVPNRAVRVKDGRRVIYILQDNSPTAIEIQLGASSDTMSEILEGNLQVGDQIVINPPIEFESGGPPFGR